MKNIDEILDRNRSIETFIADLKEKSTTPPTWSSIKEVLYPDNHKIVKDKINRPDKVIKTEKGTRIEEAARLSIGLEELLVERISEFTFSLPVKREYVFDYNNDTHQDIVNAIEKIYENVDIDTVNMERGTSFFTSCEIFTLWYAVKTENNIYGFPSKYKLKCRTFSPDKDSVELYPLLDEYGDMKAFSIYYKTKETQSDEIEYFETWTKDKHYKWSNRGDGWEDEIVYRDGEDSVTYGDEIKILKIPGIYAWRDKPVYRTGTPELRQDIEYMHSRDTDVIAYNSAPVLKIAGAIKGQEQKGETRRIYRVENGGDVSYVGWNQSTEATEKHIQRNIDWFWMLNQMPDVSFKNLQSLGNIGYDARQMMLTDAFLRIGKETKPFLQFFRREFNVIKAFLKKMNIKWDKDIDSISCKFTIQPYNPKDEKYEIEKRIMANGGKALESQKESIMRYGKSSDVDKTLGEIQEEKEKEQQASLANIMEGAV